jgi:hypothetical protein
VIEWLPTVSDAVGYAADPPDSATVASVVPPSLNVTVPVGGSSEPVIIAVSVTVWPNWLGLSEEASKTLLGSPI